MALATSNPYLSLSGSVSNLQLNNSRKLIELTSAQIENMEWMQGNLLDKMAADRQKSDVLKRKLELMQQLMRSVSDPESDEQKYTYILSVDPSGNAPVGEMGNLTLAWANLPASNRAALATAAAKEVGVELDGESFINMGGTVWVRGTVKDKLSGKQLYTYYDQQAQSISSAISALNSIASSDNLSLQNWRSKIDVATQAQSAFIKSEKERAESVLRNMG